MKDKPDGWVEYWFPIDYRNSRTLIDPVSFSVRLMEWEYTEYEEWLNENYPNQWMWSSDEYYWVSRNTTNSREGVIYFAHMSILSHFKLRFG
jgi:hypothetical protein